MLQTTWVALLLGAWSSLYLLDVFLKTQRWSARKYILWLDRTGLAVSICQFRWYTTHFNRTFVRLAQWRPRFLKNWFTCGVFFGLVAMLLSVFLLTLLIYNTLARTNVEQQQVLTPVMPGVNLPASQVSYYLLTLLVCGILHEIGHAVAAVREQVRVDGFGLFLLLIYPGAYVNLSTEQLQIISPIRQLRIYCAGVWHNFIIVLVAIAMLFVYPYALMPFYSTGKGVVITSVSESTAVSGPRGLAVGDPVTSIGGCQVTSIRDWNGCLAQSMREPSCGNCVPVSMITELDTARKAKIDPKYQYVDCCNTTSSTHLCFMYHTKNSPDNTLDELYNEYFPTLVPELSSDSESSSDESTDEHEAAEPDIIQEFVQNSQDQNMSSQQSCDDEIMSSIQHQRRSGCGCQNKCISNFQNQEIFEHILQMRELRKEEKDMYIMGKLKCKGINNGGDESGAKRKRYSYYFDDREVCKKMFLFTHDFGEKAFKNLLKHIKTHGLTPRTHGNAGRKPKWSLTYDDTKTVVQFVKNYAQQYGLPQPAASNRKDYEPPIILPAATTKKQVHQLYVESCTAASFKSVKLTSFQDIWRACCSHILIPNPRKDVCHTCEKLKDKVQIAVSSEEKILASNNLIEHVKEASDAKTVYTECVKVARSEMLVYGERAQSHPTPCSEELTEVHYTFDYAQPVTLPQHARQAGPIYFETPRKVQIFGVCIEGIYKQLNYMLDEGETIGTDGTQTHGPNSVISMIHHALETSGFGEMACVLHADNCGGQNKHRYMMAYLAWRVMTGRHRQITLHFQIPGHTRCLVDAGFAYIKKLYRRSDVDSLPQLERLINNSAKSNMAVRMTTPDGAHTFDWHDWKSYFHGKFRPIPGIRKLRSFRFTATNPGEVFLREKTDSPEQCLRILQVNADVFEDSFPDVIQNYACLPARTTTDRPMCKLQSDCHNPNIETSCVYPSIDNQTKLLRVIHGHKPPLLFLGHPLDLHYAVILSNYIPNNSLISLNLPYVIETFCKYLISLSGALVILNVVPCYALDGQWICHSFIELMLRSSIPDREARGAIYSLIVLFGTILTLLNVIIAMWTLFIS